MPQTPSFFIQWDSGCIILSFAYVSRFLLGPFGDLSLTLIRFTVAFALFTLLGCDSQSSMDEQRQSRAESDVWTDQQFDAFESDCYDYLNAMQEQAKQEFSLGSYERFDWNQESGTLVFSDDGVPKVVADIQFVGSISTTSNTWLWSWDNATILPKVKQRLTEVRQFGERHGIKQLTTAKWAATEKDGWAMTAISAKILNAMGYATGLLMTTASPSSYLRRSVGPTMNERNPFRFNSAKTRGYVHLGQLGANSPSWDSGNYHLRLSPAV